MTAIEFGIISAPLLGLIFGILQSGLAFYSQQGLRAAIDDAGRQVMTGQAQNNTAIVNATTFRDQLICAKNFLPSFVSCSSLVIDVRPASTFGSLNSSNVNASFFPNNGQYSAGNPCDIMIVRAAYPMPSYLPLITWGANFSVVRNTTGLVAYNGKMVQLMYAAAVFRNEPYVSTTGNTATSCAS